MNKTAIITITVLVVLIGGGLIYWYSSMQSPSYSAPATYQTPTSSPASMNMSSTSNPASATQPTAATTAGVGLTVSSSVKLPTTATVDISNFAFAPATLTVHKGTTVTWTNNDSAPHTVTGDNGGPSSSPLSQGKTYSYTFDTVGSFPYHCSIHPSMKATVTVIN